MDNLQNFLLIIHIILAVFIVILALLQPSGGKDGLVSSYGSLDNVVSSKSTANFLSRTTMILAFIFMANTLFLGIIAHKESRMNSIIEEVINKDDKKKINIPLAD